MSEITHDMLAEYMTSEEIALFDKAVEDVTTMGTRALEMVLARRKNGICDRYSARTDSIHVFNDINTLLRGKNAEHSRKIAPHGGIATTPYTSGALYASFHLDQSNCGLAHMHNLSYQSWRVIMDDNEVLEGIWEKLYNTSGAGADRLADYLKQKMPDRQCKEQAFKACAALLLSGCVPIAEQRGDTLTEFVKPHTKSLIRFSGPRSGNYTYEFGLWMVEHFPEHTMMMPWYSRNINSGSDIMEVIVSPTSLAKQQLPCTAVEGTSNKMRNWLGPVNAVGF